MSIFLWLLFGAIVGWIASIIMKTNTTQGLLTDIVVGIVGSFIGNLVMGLFGFPGVSGFDLYSFIVAIAGAAILIWIRRRLIPTL